MLLAERDRLDAELDDAARVLGFRPDLQLDFPADLSVSGAVAAASVLVFAFTLGSYEVPFLLGRPFPATLPVIAYQQFRDPDLAARIRGLLHDSPVHLEFRQLAGDPVMALSRLAADLEAEMIVVGSRGRSLRSTIKEIFGGSIAAHLVHRQRRPVLVVPTVITPQDRPLPWEGVE